MKTLYEAANAIEAHMLVDLLKQEGLHAHIHGEHLQGAMGELPAAGLVRLVIDEADHARARTLIERWESLQPAEPSEARPRPRFLSIGETRPSRVVMSSWGELVRHPPRPTIRARARGVRIMRVTGFLRA